MKRLFQSKLRSVTSAHDVDVGVGSLSPLPISVSDFPSLRVGPSATWDRRWDDPESADLHMQSCRALQELARPSVTSSLSRMVIRDLMHSLRDQNTDLKLFLCRASTMPRNVDYVCISCAAYLRPAGPHGDSVTLSISRQTITQAAPKVFFRSLLSRVLLDAEYMLLPRALIPIAWGVQWGYVHECIHFLMQMP